MIALMSGDNRATASWRARFRRAGVSVADALFPPRCMGCEDDVATAGALCATCWEATDFIDGRACPGCALPLDGLIGGPTLCAACLAGPRVLSAVRAAFRYDTGRELVVRFKRADRTDYAPAFAGWMARAGGDLLASADLIAPTPLHRWRLLKRRFNQAALLANAVAKRAGVACLPDALVRHRPTASQGAMPSAAARRRNVRGAFSVRPGAARRIAGRRIVLIDDVMTTGATLEACARALLKAGAADVSAIVLARVVRPGEAIILASS